MSLLFVIERRKLHWAFCKAKFVAVKKSDSTNEKNATELLGRIDHRGHGSETKCSLLIQSQQSARTEWYMTINFEIGTVCLEWGRERRTIVVKRSTTNPSVPEENMIRRMLDIVVEPEWNIKMSVCDMGPVGAIILRINICCPFSIVFWVKLGALKFLGIVR